HLDERLSGFHHWHRRQRFTVRKYHPGSLYADPAHHHDSGGTSREDVFHAGHALACVLEPHHSANVLRRLPMKRVSFPFVALLTAAVALAGCKKQEQCAPGDSAALCKAVQECFASGTAVEVCRESEKDAS